ncbi:hypothetical protein SISNIDRAFT_484532 [Sistotremastrum niveocremeum HHB9708]|uniref:Uncharacterized protein n=1 Tax=Sistotremastrum niveocremeum HHB9708 TaxID=1314777 RepID=A0A164VMN3_9AGAM|nr:hypothetical protein SISNIDRAFT_484532 [Sistotremastrum niveocremeum HHB9708]
MHPPVVHVITCTVIPLNEDLDEEDALEHLIGEPGLSAFWRLERGWLLSIQGGCVRAIHWTLFSSYLDCCDIAFLNRIKHMTHRCSADPITPLKNALIDQYYSGKFIVFYRTRQEWHGSRLFDRIAILCRPSALLTVYGFMLHDQIFLEPIASAAHQFPPAGLLHSLDETLFPGINLSVDALHWLHPNDEQDRSQALRRALRISHCWRLLTPGLGISAGSVLDHGSSWNTLISHFLSSASAREYIILSVLCKT